MKSKTGDKNKPLACVIGDLSLVRALGVSKIPVAVATSEPSSSIALSRYCETVVPTPGWVAEPDRAIAAIIDWGKRQPVPPVLFYQGDHDLLAVSRFREQLKSHFRFVLPPAPLVEDLADKLRFFELADRTRLPVPDTLLLTRESDVVKRLHGWDRFPCVLKPAMRTNWYQQIGCYQKALRAETREALFRLLDRIEIAESGLILQAAIEGGEENIASYHAYVRPDGEIVAEFTGRKIRTYPRLYGVSSYVKITDDEHVRMLGREVVEKLGFSGVLKIDFKQDANDNRYYLLEVNPRFNLWHHPATVAGVGIPAIVYQDCVDSGRLVSAGRANREVRWMEPWADRMAFREYHATGDITRLRWFVEMLTVDVNEGFCLSDPRPSLTDIFRHVKAKFARVFLRQSASAEKG